MEQTKNVMQKRIAYVISQVNECVESEGQEWVDKTVKHLNGLSKKIEEDHSIESIQHCHTKLNLVENVISAYCK